MVGSGWKETFWKESHPSKNKQENCITINSSGQWSSTACTEKHPFICMVKSSDDFCARRERRYAGKTVEVEDIFTATWEDCGKACMKNPLCEYWNWKYSSNNELKLCVLKETGKLEVDTNWFSGSKSCPEARCSAIDGQGSCCTNKNPCFHGQGDCDVDSNCVGTLKCQARGVGNSHEFHYDGHAWECCEDP